jgi:DNA-binding transcriptional LysR family regulator
MNKALLNKELDFAFINDFAVDKSIILKRIYNEILELCISDDLLKKSGPFKNEKKYFESLPYVEYQPGAPILKLWFSHHLNSKSIDLNIRSTVMDVQGIARLILGGVGAGILPSHVSDKLIKDGQKMTVFKGSGKPLKNKISIAYLRDRTHSRAVLEAMNYLKTQLAEK